MDADARIEALEAENGRLRERIALLEATLGHSFTTPLEWGLTGSQMRLLGALLHREMASKDALMAALYRDDGRDEPEIKIVDVFVCKLRAKLKPYGLTIETVWGQGYRMAPEVKARALAMIQRVAA